MKKTMVLLLAGAMLLLGTACQPANTPKETDMTESQPMSTAESIGSKQATYKVVAKACDWGPASAKVIVDTGGTVAAADLCDFRVAEQNTSGPVGEREVTAVYLCDENGSEVKDSSQYIAIDMSADPSHGGLLYYDFNRFYNVWDENYSLDIKPINAPSDLLRNISVDPQYTGVIMPEADLFQQDKIQYEGETMNYALYSPEQDDQKKPLVVWLHGQGEGGDSITVTLLSNKVTALAGEEIQEELNGAYVLVPQCPTYWPEKEKGATDFGMRPDGTSRWEAILTKLIQDVMASHPDIDTGRIYIGGCSMGGYMTMLMVKNHPELFAAAFPVCEFFRDNLLSDSDVEAIAKMPLWLTYCTQDQSVPPAAFSEATIERLKSAGAANLHVSAFEQVVDTTGQYKNDDGTPYTYNAHWVWIDVFNNQCFDGDLNLWEWMATQHK